MTRKLVYFILGLVILFNYCKKDSESPSEGLFMRLEIIVKAYNSYLQDFSRVPGVVVEILTLSKSYIQDQEMKTTTDSWGIAVFETYTNVLNPNRTYLIVLSHPTSPSLMETEHEFTIPQTPNMGSEYLIQRELIIDSN